VALRDRPLIPDPDSYEIERRPKKRDDKKKRKRDGTAATLDSYRRRCMCLPFGGTGAREEWEEKGRAGKRKKNKKRGEEGDPTRPASPYSISSALDADGHLPRKILKKRKEKKRKKRKKKEGPDHARVPLGVILRDRRRH